jgi:hypothetical protein
MLQHEARRLFDFSGRPLARVLRMVGILRRGSSDWSLVFLLEAETQMMVGATSPQTTAMVRWGWAGHDREIVINIENYDYENPIPREVETQIVNYLPDTWKIENRGSRIEVHPSGHFAGGFSDHDVFTIVAMLTHIGYFVEDLGPND